MIEINRKPKIYCNNPQCRDTKITGRMYYDGTTGMVYHDFNCSEVGRALDGHPSNHLEKGLRTISREEALKILKEGKLKNGPERK